MMAVPCCVFEDVTRFDAAITAACQSGELPVFKKYSKSKYRVIHLTPATQNRIFFCFCRTRITCFEKYKSEAKEIEQRGIDSS
jgi:hypothetical protein